MDLVRARSWWWRKQGFGLGGSAEDVLMRAGWTRSVGGANPYFTLFSRAGIRQEMAEAEVAALNIHELPSARGCTFILPRAHFALGLQLAEPGAEVPINQARKYLGVPEEEVVVLCEAIVDALGDKEMDPAQLRDLLGDKVRKLGEEGKKRGQTTTLPNALGRLQAHGRIRRVPVSGRLDEQRYRYVRWDAPRFEGTAEEAHRELAKLYFGWIGPATMANFQWFSALGVGAAKKAVADLGLVDLGDGWLILPEDRDEWEAFQPIKEPEYGLVCGIDNLVLHRRDLRSLTADEDAEREMVGERAFARISGLQDSENHLIFDRGRMIGFWEFDSEAGELVWFTFEPPSSALRTEIERTQEFARSLGDVRSFSLDSPASRRPRLALLRELVGR